MGLNNDGFSGVDIEQIALEKTIIVGTQAPNTFPCVKIDDNGKSLLKMEIATSGGTIINSTAGYDCSYVDNSWLSHGGIYSLSVGNKINISAGAGGFEWITSGPSRLNTPFQDFLCTHAFNVNTRLFTVASTQRTHLMGTRCDIQYDEIYMIGNTNFTNNVHINGSLFVNGELYCSHMTCQQQTNFTSPSDTIKGFINPGQSFLVFNGASLASKELIQPTLGWTQLDKLPDKPGMVDCYIAIELPDPIGLIEVPCRIGFPNGISLMSDATHTIVPQAQTIVMSAGTRQPGCGINKSDLTGPGHMHSFIGPACQSAKNTGSFLKEAKEAMESETPSKAKPTMPNGVATLEQVPKMIVDACQNSLIEYGKQIWDDINPFGSIPWI